ncbi:hypothetical protein BFU36_04830 [Sulfolobus sp. A20]|nr:hypothetical protein BFU36_04830 [Sulfolobus sp. A20]TRM73229.1 endonuclease [Sulfolobus sp. E5]TRM77778.1 endonuclease [Sulfolobus sp. A20-N-F8]TRM83944.1 endonuclease [Sulfolobus sp. A20-N-F6]TRM88708.1 endonuclease [Sulfolobus sp. C3]TRM94755.1 endonuclease [Sulfolobus sp. A20-N-G8]TRM97713.1 endonuclease [Sulfolobus sp. B1]TRN00083.1 endonuclease [Sulfolobus sp. F1]TRN03098.1 endonuclease [Sulfolobus sp. E1]
MNISNLDKVIIMSEDNESELTKIYNFIINYSTKTLSELPLNSISWDKLDVYIDLRQRGKIVEESDDKTLIIKEKNKKSTLVLVINENEKINFKYILEKLQQARNMNIELVISIVDKYGDVTYYNLSEIKMTK